MKIGTLKLRGGLVLAPMAGYTDAAFRSLCVEQGAALTYTEMISAKALYYGNKNTKPLLQVADNEGPVALQLFGDDPDLLAEEASRLEDGPYDIFDVNMACPVPKVVNNGEGSALMLRPEKVAAIVRTMTDRLRKPVSVKIRKGFDESHVNAVEIARIAEDNGAAMVAVHGRTRTQMYHGAADYGIIRQVREAVQIPVLGSGDIYSAEDARRMMRETGVDGVMAARGARGNPWIFRVFLDPSFQGPSPAEIRDMILRQLHLMISGSLQPEAERGAVRQMRKHAGFYVAGHPYAATIRRLVNQCETAARFEEILYQYLS